MKSDAEFYEDIMDKFQNTPNLSYAHITLSTDDGLVTMAGKVESFFEKQVAERAVKSIIGVNGIVNNLEVDFTKSLRLSDTDITKAALEALRWDIEVPYDTIQVTVEDGHVKLTEEVNWWYQRNAAEKVVRRLKGIKSLTNEINIQSPIVEKDIKKQIFREFHRHA